MKFKNRDDAALKLLPCLEKYGKQGTVVLAIPRGGVPIAFHITKHYHLPLELLMTKKIGHPFSPEFAIGAVSLEDQILDEGNQVSETYIRNSVSSIRETLREKYKKFMGNHVAANIENKTVIVVDDGIATGNTILASLKMLRKKNPAQIVVVAPVASTQAAQKIKEQVNDFICLDVSPDFVGVGAYYEDFSEVGDEEVIRLFKEANNFNDAG